MDTDDKVKNEILTTETDKKVVADDECLELKHIQYKSMILSGVPCSMEYGVDNIERLNNLEKFLETSTVKTKTDGWNKLDMTVKMQKVTDFVHEYHKEHSLSDSERDDLYKYVRDCLDKKKLTRVKDVDYNAETGKLVTIHGLYYNKTSKKYTIKNSDAKKGSVLSRLPQKKKTLKKTSSVVEKESDSK